MEKAKTASRYSAEVRSRAVRMVLETRRIAPRSGQR